MSEPTSCTFNRDQRCLKGAGCLAHGIECMRRVAAFSQRPMLGAIAAATGWQPIDSAPKDGTWLLGWAQRDSCPYRISWGRNQRGELAWCTAFAAFVPGYITHWQPLSPPSAHGEIRG